MPRVKTVAITRPREDGEIMAASFAKKGIRTVLIPMLHIHTLDGSAQELEKHLSKPFQAICVTSKHAVRLLANQKRGREAPLFAVGKATAQALKNAGFTNVAVAEGNVDSLIQLLKKKCIPEGGVILYIRGNYVTSDILSILSDGGYECREVVAYDAILEKELPAEYIAKLTSGEVDEVLFFSTRSAAHYVQLMEHYALQRFHNSVTAISISAEISEAVRNLPWKERRLEKLD